MSEHKYKLGAQGQLLFMDLSNVAPYNNYDTVVCLIDVSPKDTRAVIDASSACGPDKEAGIASFTITGSGIHLLDPDTGKVSGTSLRIALRNNITCGFKISPVSPEKGDEIEEGTCFVADLGSTYNFNQPTNFTFTLQPYGTSTITSFEES